MHALLDLTVSDALASVLDRFSFLSDAADVALEPALQDAVGPVTAILQPGSGPRAMRKQHQLLNGIQQRGWPRYAI